MPHIPRVDQLVVKLPPFHRLRWRLFREWCFFRVLVQSLGPRFLLLLLLVGFGAAALCTIASERPLSLAEAFYLAFSLLLGEPATSLPTHWLLRVLYFGAPILGLAVVVETIVDLGHILRDRQTNRQAWSRVMAKSLVDHVIVVGMGRVGWRTYCALRRLGTRLVVVDQNEDSEFIAEIRSQGIPILIGDARRDSLLDSAGVTRARAIVIATNNDLVNLEVALDARRKHPSIRVVMRMFDQNMADKVHQGFEIPAVLSTAALAAPTFAAAALVQNVISTTVLDNQLLLTVRHLVDSDDPWCGRTTGEIATTHQVGVVSHHPNNGPIRLFPPMLTQVNAGDAVVVQGPYQTLVDINVARF